MVLVKKTIYKTEKTIFPSVSHLSPLSYFLTLRGLLFLKNIYLRINVQTYHNRYTLSMVQTVYVKTTVKRSLKSNNQSRADGSGME